MMLHRGLALFLASTLLATGSALSQTLPAPGAPVSTDGKALGDCLIAHSTAEHERLMRAMIVDALNDDADGLNKSMLAATMGIIATAQQSCGLKMTDLQKPLFAEGMGVYGEYLGQKIMTSAMAKLGMQN